MLIEYGATDATVAEVCAAVRGLAAYHGAMTEAFGAVLDDEADAV